MEGSVRKRGEKWYYSFEAAKIDGKRQRIERVGGLTKPEAEAALRKAITDYENGESIDLSNISVSDYFDYWYENYVKKNLKYNTQINYLNVIKKYIKPEIGKLKLKSLGPAKLQELVNELPDMGLAKHTVEIIVTVLKGALKKAVYPWQLIKSNPMQYIEMPKYDQYNKKTKEKLKVITIEDYKKILGFVGPENSFYIPLLLGFHTGMRRGEVCGLTWDCVNLEEKTLKVNKTIINTYGGWQIGTPKTQSSYREISFGETLYRELKTHRKHQLEHKMFYQAEYQDSNFVCTKENGKLVTPNSIKWSCTNIQRKLGIDFNFHSLRHTHATLLMESGAKIKAIQERLGHSRASTTTDTYSHLTKKMQQETVDIFEERISK